VDIVVLIKQVPDTAARIQDRVRDGTVDLEDITWITNPYDEYAVEEALRLRERHGGTVTLVAHGPDRVQSALKDMLALGADEAFQVWDPAFADLGPRGVARVLAAAIEKGPHDLVWAGWKAVDDDRGLVPVYVARYLGLPHVSFVTQIDIDDGHATVRREVEGGHEILQVPLPAVFSAQKGLNEVRYASLKGIMAVKKKQIGVWTAADLGVNPDDLPAPGVVIRDVSPPPPRPPGRILDGSPEEAAGELARLLREEAKVI